MHAKRNDSRRVGLLLPSANTVMEPDFYRTLPKTITVHTTRMYLPETTIEGEMEMLDKHVLPAARNIADVRPDVVVFGCTSAGALRGKQYEEELVQAISEVVHAPVVSVMSAVKEDLFEADVKRLIVVTPYVRPVNERIASSLREDGFEVLSIAGMGISQSIQLGEIPGEEIVAFSREALRGYHPDGVFLSCTNFQAMSILPVLSKEFPFPVFSSNQSAYNRTISMLEQHHP